MDGRCVKNMLNQRAQNVCEFLLPGGKVEGHNYVSSPEFVGDYRFGQLPKGMI